MIPTVTIDGVPDPIPEGLVVLDVREHRGGVPPAARCGHRLDRHLGAVPVVLQRGAQEADRDDRVVDDAGPGAAPDPAGPLLERHPHLLALPRGGDTGVVLGREVRRVPRVERSGVERVERDDPQVAHRTRCTRPSSQTGPSDS